MSNNVTQSLENNLISLASSLYSMNAEVKDIYQYYWGSDANTLVGALASGSTPATSGASGSLSKAQFLSGITIAEQVKNFMGNAAVSQGGYLGMCDTIRNANSPASPVLSQNVEDLGARMKQVVLNLIQLNKDASNIEKIYNSSYLSAIVGGIPASNVIFGCNLTQAKLVSAIVLCQQLQKLMNNEAVTTGDYLATITNLVIGG